MKISSMLLVVLAIILEVAGGITLRGSLQYKLDASSNTPGGPPSCKVMTEMLQRIYYMRARLGEVAAALGTIGYTPGREWVVDQGIGTVTYDNISQVVCNLLEGPSAFNPRGAQEISSKGCPFGSQQLKALQFMHHEFNDTSAESEKFSAAQTIFVDLLKDLENSALSLYNFRECPLGSGEFKSHQLCMLFREDLSKGLKIYQSSLQFMKARLYSLKARVKAIDRGTSRECYVSKEPKEESYNHKHEEWCHQIIAMTDAILDGRKAQKQWLKVLGNDMQRLGVMSMQLTRRVHDPVLKQDKIPLTALGNLETSWKHLAKPMQALRITGVKRAEHSGSVDGAMLSIAGLLKNLSNKEGCLAEAFRLRYSARSCKSLKTQLVTAMQERQTDLDELTNTANNLFVSASTGLRSKNCTGAPMTEGCWMRLPTGCPKIPKWKAADKWTRDRFGEESTGSGQNSVVCLTSRKLQMDSLCGVMNTETRFIPGA